MSLTAPLLEPTRSSAPARPRSGSRFWTGRSRIRLRRDPQLLLAIAIALPVILIEGLSGGRQRPEYLGVPMAFVAVQLMLGNLSRPPTWLTTARLGLSLVFVAGANVLLDASGQLPLTALAIPVVALAAATGGFGGIAVAVAGIVMTLAPILAGFLPGDLRQQHLAIGMAEIALAAGTRQLVGSLERFAQRLRQANARDRRQSRNLAAVESLGRLLASEGPTPDALDRVIGLLERRFGYRYPSVYLWDGTALQLGAQRNYLSPIQTIGLDRGVLGRVARTRVPAFLPDARSDPDFLSGDPAVRSEIAVPLLHAEELLGVVNVETGERRLDRDDFALMQIVGDRIAVALALGRERQKLTERAALLDRLAAFSSRLNATLDPAAVLQVVADAAVDVIDAPGFVVVSRAPGDETFRISAVHGPDQRVLGAPVEAGNGLTGRAMAEGGVVVEDRFERAAFAESTRATVDVPAVAGMAAPLVRDDEVVGAIGWYRTDLTRPYSPQEREVAQLVASQVSLALANAHLHWLTLDAAITDPLTGLHNRRHFDASMARADLLRDRAPLERRDPRSAILFDLDHFGQVNKRHGHRVGDQVLQLFADTLRGRIRGSDLVARYGGEEFVVILEGATRDDAVRIADEVRRAFAAKSIDTPDGERLHTTVSAGCSGLEPEEIAAAALLERADVALAMAKAGGRNLVVAA